MGMGVGVGVGVAFPDLEMPPCPSLFNMFLFSVSGIEKLLTRLDKENFLKINSNLRGV